MRTNRFHSQGRWEFALRSDKSYLTYMASALLAGVVILSTYMLMAEG